MAQYGTEILGFVHRYQVLKAQHEDSENLVKELLVFAENAESRLRSEKHQLEKDLKETRLDLDDAVKSRRELQTSLYEAEQRANYYNADAHRTENQYIIVLIDADGLVFKESLIKQGVEGGKQAAIALKSTILKQCGDYTGTMEVLVKAIGNLSGLGAALRRDGSLQKDTDLRDFFLGFSQGEPMSDFVDIGPDKERAELKIRELTKWHLRNINCRQVVLGVSHDAGYAPFVASIRKNETTKNTVSILEGQPMVPELAITDVNVVNFTDTLFRSDKLVDRLPLRLSSPASTVTPVPSSASSVVGAPSYAGVINAPKVSPPPTLNIPLLNKVAPAPPRAAVAKLPQWNPGARGLDPPIQVNQAALENLKKRRDGDKLCNNHYLRGPCAKGNACCFEHNYKPNAEEKIAIAFLARLNPCTSGQNCDVSDCIYGHHCPSTINGQCTHPYCKFRPDEHPTGTKYRATYRNGDYSN